jgi:hypothetical protein
MYKIKRITGVIYLNVNQSFTFTKKIMFQFYYPIGVNNSFFSNSYFFKKIMIVNLNTVFPFLN